MPTAWYNMENEFLQNVAIRKAIAWATDYDNIIANAMTNQSPTFADVPRSVMNPTDGEQALYDHEAVKDLQWVGNDIEGAKALLDEAGIVDTDGDGYRELNGKKVTLNACCPNGWTDWQAAMQIVAEAGQKIGLDIQTYYPEWSVYQTVYTKASQTEYDIFMQSPAGAQPASPWARVRALMSSEFLGRDNNWTGNFGHYSNARIDEILAQIPTTTDEETLKALYTEATEIYLTEVPSFSLMYRPEQFHAVNESVWTGYPVAGDGFNIPPANLTDGYGIAALYHLRNVD
jgi:peptide/nickel transport system substrate-binding protein